MCGKIKATELKPCQLSLQPFFSCWSCEQMMECHQNLLYEEENERAHFSFNSQTLVPRLISRLGEREGNAVLNEKKGEERKNSLSFIWYGNISCSHTQRGYENKQLGDGRDKGNPVRKGRGGKPERWREWFVFLQRKGDGRRRKGGKMEETQR